MQVLVQHIRAELFTTMNFSFRNLITFIFFFESYKNTFDYYS